VVVAHPGQNPVKHANERDERLVEPAKWIVGVVHFGGGLP